MSPMPTGELPGLPSNTPPEKPAKRRKANGKNGSASRKKRKAVEEPDEEESSEYSAPLTLGAAGTEPRARKKMLFESVTADLGASIGTAQQTAAIEPTAPTALFAAPAAPEEVAPAAPEIPTRELASQASDGAAPVADVKGAVFQVATLVMHSSLQTPEEAEVPTPQWGEVPTASAATAWPAEEPEAEPATTLADVLESPVAAETEEEDLAPAAKPEPVATHFAETPEPIVTPAPESVQTIEQEIPIPEVLATQPAAAAVEPAPVHPAPAAMSRFEAVAARAARMVAQNGARSAAQAPQPNRAAAPSREAPRAAELPVLAGDIYGYWTRMKNGRRFPSRLDFDAEQVAEYWPNSMLLTCAKSAASSQVTFSSVLRLGTNRRNRTDEDLNITSMITEWILATGGEAARAGKPVQDTEVFPSSDGSRAYKIVALPLSDQQTQVDHVLCHLSRS